MKIFTRGASMLDAQQSTLLQDQLMELGALFVSLQPVKGLALALYSNEGHLLASTSPSVGLAEGLPFGEPTMVTDIYFHSDRKDNNFAWKQIKSEHLSSCPFFLIQANAVDHVSLASLCQFGASFMLRQLELLEKTRALKQVVREQEAIIDHISDGLLVMDRLGAIRYLNSTAARLLKLDLVRAIGVPLKDLLDYNINIEPVFRTGNGYIDKELQIDSPNLRLHILDTVIPIRDDEGNVVSVVNTFREMSRVRELTQRMAGDLARYHFSDVLGQDRNLRKALATAQRAAQTDSNILLYGESGTGKEIFAQAIHNDGKRSNGPFVAINSAALPRDQIEGDLFGYAAGNSVGGEMTGRPGRFEQASGGTIFLDEISEMPLDVQGKILRVLQERQVTRIGGGRSIPVDVRVVVASSRNLSDMVLRHMFREDLYYRLNVLCIELPSLRSRGDDVVKLAEEFIRRYCAALHRSPIRLGGKAVGQLLECDWRGNIRQLQNVIERLVNLVESDHLDEFPLEWLEDKVHPDPLPDEYGSWSRVMTLNEYERLGVRLALEASSFNISQASEILGITRQTLYAKMKRHGFEVSAKLSERNSFF